MRPASARIDLDALRHNYRLARALAGGRALAIVKADAYGHGAAACAAALSADADGFGVACIEEALALREAGITRPILLLEGFFEADELPLIEYHHLWCVVGSTWQIETLERYKPRQPLTLWLKIDSGMHRLGIPAATFDEAWRRLHALPWARSVVAMTHFSHADAPNAARTLNQIAAFDRACASVDPSNTSLANSAGLLAWPDARRGWSRPGLMLYGASPFDAPIADTNRLRPVMTLRSRIIAVKDVPPGESIGYAATFVTPHAMRIGIVAMGYADGYPQYAPHGTPVAVDGKPSRTVGRVSMDMMAVDLTPFPEAGIGTPVELWGVQISASEVARRCGTSAYDLLSGIKRIPRSYVELQPVP